MAMYLIAIVFVVLINVGAWGYLLRSYLSQQAEARERLEVIEARLTTVEKTINPRMTFTTTEPPPYAPSQHAQGSCYGACNRPIDESTIRIASPVR